MTPVASSLSGWDTQKDCLLYTLLRKPKVQEALGNIQHCQRYSENIGIFTKYSENIDEGRQLAKVFQCASRS